MWKLLIDEDMPRSTGVVLRQAGHTIQDRRHVGLRGQSDEEIFQYPQAQGAILLTADKGFGNIVHFPPGTLEGHRALQWCSEGSDPAQRRVRSSEDSILLSRQHYRLNNSSTNRCLSIST